MSLRTFIRRFTAATRSPPGKWLVAERIEEAKRQLTTGHASIDVIAGAVGLGTPHTLRHHFRRCVGVTPKEYRLRFGTAQWSGPSKPEVKRLYHQP